MCVRTRVRTSTSARIRRAQFFIKTAATFRRISRAMFVCRSRYFMLALRYINCACLAGEATSACAHVFHAGGTHEHRRPTPRRTPIMKLINSGATSLKQYISRPGAVFFVCVCVGCCYTLFARARQAGASCERCQARSSRSVFRSVVPFSAQSRLGSSTRARFFTPGARKRI